MACICVSIMLFVNHLQLNMVNYDSRQASRDSLVASVKLKILYFSLEYPVLQG